MIKIPLSNSDLFAIVDDEDFALVSRYKWHVRRTKNSNTVYASASKHVPGRRSPVNIRMHRLITGAPKGMEVDHIDRNGLNNTRGNLRVCTSTENRRNSTSECGNSRFKGVSFDKTKGRFVASISVNNKTIHLGTYADEISAAMAYNEGAEKHHGAFARLNVTPPVSHETGVPKKYDHPQVNISPAELGMGE